MFYSENILAKKGPLANIWLAANWDRKLSKVQILHTNITDAIEDLVHADLPPMALRLSGQLLLGVSKIYGRQVKYLLEDCGDALSKFSANNTSDQMNETTKKHIHNQNNNARKNTATIQELKADDFEPTEFNVE